jgi:hypothetical protein
MLVHNATETSLKEKRVNRTPPDKEGDANATGHRNAHNNFKNLEYRHRYHYHFNIAFLCSHLVMNIYLSSAGFKRSCRPFFTAVNSIPARSQ